MEIDDGSTGVGKGSGNYKVMQKLVTMRPVFEIYDEQTGEKVAIARQTWLSFLRSTMHVEDIHGTRILTAKGGFFDLTFWLLDPNGQKIAKLRRPIFALRKNFTIFYRDETIKAQGGYMAWGFNAVSSSGIPAFKFDKKILAIRDQFRVTVGDYMDWTHAVTSAIVIDTIFFKGKGCGCRLIFCVSLFIIIIAMMIMMILPLFMTP